MSPASASRDTRAVTLVRWRASVVRMKSSNEMSSRAQTSLNAVSMPSQKASGSTPSSRARWNTFCECSSLPIMKRVSTPQSRL